MGCVRLHYAMEVNANMVRLVFAIAILIFACLSCIGGPEVVRMGTEGAYPPYNFINDGGAVDGFERELGDELCWRADLECVWVTNEWDSIVPNLVEGKYDTIMAGMEHHRRAGRGHRLHAAVHPAQCVGLRCPGGSGRWSDCR